ncbi:cathepsin D [Malassezia vespertilionis]|uniref:Peptidase A1 domain-containing protein n=1 Tax=Malassezia vespertilionis TaxID=2020962 RepID=A0A2N1J7P6_9BASI|nr:cathepsin D [Malassezia vespertilionis]PKI82587.1 hypothetical protein MVES_003425 [Malassezia vespertilionis]WFD08492.1 cathepsin D [Malassezia vespertilionis]
MVSISINGGLLILAALVLSVSAAPNAASAAAAPTQEPKVSYSAPIKINRNALHPRNGNLKEGDLAKWIARERARIDSKYGHHNKRDSNETMHKRQYVGLADVGRDSFYFAQIGIGTPEESFNVVLDTGSADFWVADAQCVPQQGCPNDMQRYDSSKSSSFKDSSKSFHVPYGSGEVAGSLAAEDVSLAGYKVDGLTFGRASEMQENTLFPPTSGLMGMGFESLASSRSTPFWEVLAMRGALKDPLFSFQLATNQDARRVNEINTGGLFTLGALDNNQFQGDINWVPLLKQYGPKGIGYWGIRLDSVQINGNRPIGLGNGNTVAVDTGTTLIGAPPPIVEQVYSQIPGARSASSSSMSSSGHYMYPCKQKFEVKFTFNGRTFSLNDEQMNLGAVSTTGQYCIGAIFAQPTSPNSAMPAWILGDTFLRTVFSAYRFDPPAVGFADLSADGVQTKAMTSIQTHTTVAEQSAFTGGGGGGGGGGGPLPTRSSQNGISRLFGGDGLPTPSVASVPSGMPPPRSSARIAFGRTSQAVYATVATTLAATLLVCFSVI